MIDSHATAARAPRRLIGPRVLPSARAAIAQARVDSPLGGITLAATERGLCGLWFDGQLHHPGSIDAPLDPAQPFIAMAIDELAAYWGGTDRRPVRARTPARRPTSASGFNTPIDLIGTPFQRAVWTALRNLPPGRTASYGELARACGHAEAVRAVGVAIGRNPVSVLVPCHRVVGADGALTGYAGGLDRKRRLLQIEQATAA
jgi:methylated-DNA-[protein]-cysteine S-methyltransferase